MIRLTRLSGAPFVLNSDLIERIDQTPDTVITLGDGTKYVAAEGIDQVVAAVREHRAQIIALSEVVALPPRSVSVDPDPVDTGLALVSQLRRAVEGGER